MQLRRPVVRETCPIVDVIDRKKKADSRPKVGSGEVAVQILHMASNWRGNSWMLEK